MIKDIFSKTNRTLLAELVRSDFKLRYHRSVLGYAWSLLRPLFMFGILFVVFTYVFRVNKGIPHYPIYLFIGVVMWGFFTEMTSQSLSSIVSRGTLIRKVRIPRWLIIVATSISALINVTLNMTIVFILAALTGLDFMRTGFMLPIYIAEVYVFALGISLILSVLYVKFRDISYIWDVITQAGFYATPIIYPLSFIKNVTAQKLVFLNPMAHAIQGARENFVTKHTATIGEVYGSKFAFLIPFTVIGVILLFGIWYFKKHAPNFAEDL